MIDYAMRVYRAAIASSQRCEIRRDAASLLRNDKDKHVQFIKEVYKRHRDPIHAATHLVKVAAWLREVPDTEIGSPSYCFKRSLRQSAYSSFIMTDLARDHHEDCREGIWNAGRYFDDEKALNRVINFGIHAGFVFISMTGMVLIGATAMPVACRVASMLGGGGLAGPGATILTSVALLGAAYYAACFFMQRADRLIKRVVTLSEIRSLSTARMFDMVTIYNETYGFANMPPASLARNAEPSATLPALDAGPLPRCRTALTSVPQ